MSAVAVSVTGLGKRYRPAEERYTALRDSLANVVGAPFAGARRLFSTTPRAAQRVALPEYWALRNVDFEVREGEVFGLVGSNGAGKSTLLKILAGVTDPTEGRAQIHGRLGSMLEIGAGFHDELTGRENVYVNGILLGMTRSEIDRRFDEIVDFFGYPTFIDTIVKRYSSGMYMRLAFAVAAHLQTEVLLVDEVLAVGDAAFRAKCESKIRDIAKDGRTIFFVSHTMSSVIHLCTRCAWLDKGALLRVGEPQAIVDAYLTTPSASAPATRRIATIAAPAVATGVRVLALEILDAQGHHNAAIPMGGRLRVRLEVEAEQATHLTQLCVAVERLDGARVAMLSCADATRARPLALAPGTASFRVEAELPLAPGRYLLKSSLRAGVGESEIDVRSLELFVEGKEADDGLPALLRPASAWEIR